MPTYELIFKPGSPSDRAGVDKVVTADSYITHGRFFRFQTDGGPAILISQADVLQIKEQSET